MHPFSTRKYGNKILSFCQIYLPSIILFKLNSIKLITSFFVSSSILLIFFITVIAFFKLKKSFKFLIPLSSRVLNTVENINLRLRTYTGGYQRFEYDHYRGGAPWPIANLWMTLYYLENGEKKKAKESFDFVLKTAGKYSFLGEQIDNNTLKPNWVIGLGWSHAMFIIVLEKMMNM